MYKGKNHSVKGFEISKINIAPIPNTIKSDATTFWLSLFLIEFIIKVEVITKNTKPIIFKENRFKV